MSKRTERTTERVAERLEGRLGLSQRRWEKVLEILVALALSFAALATSWSGYQASRWGGLMVILFNQASALRIEAARAADLAFQQTQIDVALFAGWIEAIANQNQPLVDFYRARFRAEFAPAFAAWLASCPLENPAAAASPFELAEYCLSALIARFESFLVRSALLATALALLGLGLVNLVRYPIY